MITNVEDKIKSFCQERLDKLGISESDNRVSVMHPDYPPQKMPVFSPDKNDNIKILYLDPSGHIIEYDKNGKLQSFFRTRLKEPRNGMKYVQPTNSEVYPFLPPRIIDKFKNQEKIETLIITEGEFKAFKGSLEGLNIIGIGGIHSYAEKGKLKINDYINDIIKTCQVKNIILLFDSDCLHVEYKEGEDLYTRPNSFFSAVRNFKELTKPLEVDVYFSHLIPIQNPNTKGLDDYLIDPNVDNEILKQELFSFTVDTQRQYINCISISENSISKIRNYFGIDSADSFYSKYAHILQEQEFLYNTHKYQYNGEKLIRLRHGDADLFLRVGCDYFKIIHIPQHNGTIRRELKKWKKSEIIQDYIKKGFKDFIDQIPRYDGFCSIPDNTNGYRRTHSIEVNGKNFKTYNLYEPIYHSFSDRFPHQTLLFLKHITNSQKDDHVDEMGDPLTVFLDYLTILFKHPTQSLPVQCLVSKIQGTGKTTYANWLSDIFQSNAVILSNAELKMDFNAHYATKFLIIIDENLIALDRIIEKERIKKLATSKKILVQFKGADLIEADYFGKLILLSNHETNFIPLETTDIRFWILKVPEVKEEDPDLQEKLKAEIPAFLSFLNKRKIHHPKESRSWFNYKYIENEQLRTIIDNSKSILEMDLTAFVEEYMIMNNLSEFKIDLKRLQERVNEYAGSRFKHSAANIKRFLKYEKGMLPDKPQQFELFLDTVDTPGVTQSLKYIGRTYTFKWEDWIKDENINTPKIS